MHKRPPIYRALKRGTPGSKVTECGAHLADVLRQSGRKNWFLNRRGNVL